MRARYNGCSVIAGAVHSQRGGEVYHNGCSEGHVPSRRERGLERDVSALIAAYDDAFAHDAHARHLFPGLGHLERRTDRSRNTRRGRYVNAGVGGM